MLFKIAFVLLIAWLVGILGMNPVGELVHVLLIVGLMVHGRGSSGRNLVTPSPNS